MCALVARPDRRPKIGADAASRTCVQIAERNVCDVCAQLRGEHVAGAPLALMDWHDEGLLNWHRPAVCAQPEIERSDGLIVVLAIGTCARASFFFPLSPPSFAFSVAFSSR